MTVGAIVMGLKFDGSIASPLGIEVVISFFAQFQNTFSP